LLAHENLLVWGVILTQTTENFHFQLVQNTLSSEYALMVDLLEPLEKQDPSQSEFDQTSGLDLGSQNVDTTKNEAEK
jgi:hypothetical protein